MSHVPVLNMLIEILTKGASELKFNYLCLEENVIIIAMKRCLYTLTCTVYQISVESAHSLYIHKISSHTILMIFFHFTLVSMYIVNFCTTTNSYILSCYTVVVSYRSLSICELLWFPSYYLFYKMADTSLKLVKLSVVASSCQQCDNCYLAIVFIFIFCIRPIYFVPYAVHDYLYSTMSILLLLVQKTLGKRGGGAATYVSYLNRRIKKSYKIKYRISLSNARISGINTSCPPPKWWRKPKVYLMLLSIYW